MKKLTILTLSLLACTSLIKAQNTGSSYKTALGVKVYPGAISIKHFTKKNVALEGLGYFHEDGMRLTGLYEIHGDINNADGLKWYVGPGAHIGVWNDRWKNNNPNRNNGIVIGIDGVLGLDYKVKGIPLNISLDWQPSFNLVGYSYFEGQWGGFGIRYTF